MYVTHTYAHTDIYTCYIDAVYVHVLTFCGVTKRQEDGTQRRQREGERERERETQTEREREREREKERASERQKEGFVLSRVRAIFSSHVTFVCQVADSLALPHCRLRYPNSFSPVQLGHVSLAGVASMVQAEDRPKP